MKNKRIIDGTPYFLGSVLLLALQQLLFGVFGFLFFTLSSVIFLVYHYVLIKKYFPIIFFLMSILFGGFIWWLIQGEDVGFGLIFIPYVWGCIVQIWAGLILGVRGNKKGL